MAPNDPSLAESRGPSRRALAKWIVFTLVAASAVLVYLGWGDQVTLEHLARRESALRDYQARHPWLVFGAGFAVYVIVTGLSLPGAVVLTLVFGWFMGFGSALAMVSVASTAGATLAFLLSRFLFRDAIRTRFGDRLATFNKALEREGAYYLFTLRLIPLVPFFVINLVMGLTPIRVWTFWWVSQLGMLPGTAAYVYAGSSVPSLGALAEKGVGGIFSTQLLAALVLLGLLPIVAKRILGRFRKPNVKIPSP